MPRYTPPDCYRVCLDCGHSYIGQAGLNPVRCGERALCEFCITERPWWKIGLGKDREIVRAVPLWVPPL